MIPIVTIPAIKESMRKACSGKEPELKHSPMTKAAMSFW